MHLRHIDPGSSEWMDAMLEGEEQPVQGGTHRGRGKPESAMASSMETLGGGGGRDSDAARSALGTEMR